MNLETGSRLQTLTIQETGGTEKTVSRGVEIIKEMLSEANLAEREPVPASHLIVGLECGGSDAYSGITVSIALHSVSLFHSSSALRKASASRFNSIGSCGV